MAWMEEIRAARENNSRPEHPWRAILQTIEGDVCHDGVERIATDRLFDLPDVCFPTTCRNKKERPRHKKN